MKVPFKSNYVVSAEVGGSHITAAVCDVPRHAVIRSTIVRAELNSNSSADDILKIWVSAIKEAVRRFHLPGFIKLPIITENDQNVFVRAISIFDKYLIHDHEKKFGKKRPSGNYH
jgi:hypothetical protein